MKEKNTKKKRTANKKARKKNLGIPAALATVVLLLLFLYAVGFWYYNFHFLPGTTVNQTDVSGMKIQDISKLPKEYRLTVLEQDPEGREISSTITGSSIGLRLEAKDALEAILKEQPAAKWFWSKGGSHELSAFLSYDESALTAAVKGLPGLDPVQSQLPQAAYIDKRADGNGYEIIAEQAGNRLVEEKALEAVRQAIVQMEEAVNLVEEDCYEKPEFVAGDDYLQGQLRLLNNLSGLTITYEFGENTEVLDGNQISQWITIENNEAVLDKEQVAEYVASLRKKYDTIFRSRSFQTSYGQTITLTTGDYGWWMNYGQETEELYEMILNGESGSRTPVYYQTAASYETPDYGTTYVEINLTAQHMFYYENGTLVLESDIVSGNPSRGNGTPDGVYGITYKQRDATLVGETYETPVSYWMPFNGNIGLHDASWQSSFGGNRYLTRGSHGCINLPVSAARDLFGYIEKGTPVICYFLPGTEAKTEPEDMPAA